MQGLCKFGEVKKINGIEYLECTIANGYCAFIRYCSNEKCLKMIERYKNCPNRRMELAKEGNNEKV